MSPSSIAEILLVRSVEETRDAPLAPEAVIDALAAAGEPVDERSWLARRAAYLLDRELGWARPVLWLAEWPVWGTGAMLAGPVLLGLASNYVGPSERIHVVLNPIVVLIGWNLAVYIVLAALALHAPWRRPVAKRDGSAPVAREVPSGQPEAAGRRPPGSGPGPLTSWLGRRLIAPLWLRLRGITGESRAHAIALSRVGRTFWQHWVRLNWPTLGPRVRLALHLAAIGLIVGAVGGTYLRGLFFDYNIVWRSTFVTDPRTITALLAWMLGPATLLTGRNPIGEAETAQLMTPDGSPAAAWIHLYAVLALVLVAMPRAALAGQAWLQLRRARQRVTVDVDDPYVERLLTSARRLAVRRLEDDLATATRVEYAKFAEGLATFVADRLYDVRIAPRIRAFRERGGQVRALEEDIAAICDGFESDLRTHLFEAQADFVQSLSRAIERVIGTRRALDTMSPEMLGKHVRTIGLASTGDVGSVVGYGLADAIAATVSAAVAMAAGTVSGGFGKTLGVAVLVGVVKSGPVAWVVGAVGGLVMATAGWWLGRERLSVSLKQVSLPAVVVKAILWPARLERMLVEGRERCRTSVREAVDRSLEPLTPAIAAQIWQGLKPMLGEQYRQAIQRPTPPS